MNETKKKEQLRNNSRVDLKQLHTYFEQMQMNVSHSMKNILFETGMKQIIDFEGKKSLKVFDSWFVGIDFLNIALSHNLENDQRILEGNIFEQCSFVDCKGITSMNECVFINCTFADCNFEETKFIDCYFSNTTITSCDFRYANFSLSNYKGIYVDESSKVDGSLLASKEEQDDVPEKDINKYRIVIHLLKSSLELIYDATKYIDKDDMSLDSIAADLSQCIQEKEQFIESEDLKLMGVNEIIENVIQHDRWANSIIKNIPKPDIDWTKCNYKNFDFSEKNLSKIDFSGSSLKGCDFTNTNLTDVNFIDCDLTGANFTNSIFSNNVFDDAILENIIMDKKNQKLFKQANITFNTNENGFHEILKSNKKGKAIL